MLIGKKIIRPLFFQLLLVCTIYSQAVDITQPELFVKYLKLASSKENAEPIIDSLMDSEGCKMIIEQNNIARKLTAGQYKDLLVSIAEHRPIPFDTTGMSIKEKGGVMALKFAVFPRIQWALKNLDVVENLVNNFSNIDVYKEAVDLASSYLPGKLTLKPKLYFVMGGRAGAASLSGDRLYFDLLAMCYSPTRNVFREVDEKKITSFFAHETHHMGFGQINEEFYKKLSFTENGKRIYRILSGLVSEGSATFFFDAQEDINILKEKRNFIKLLADPDSLLKMIEEILISLFEEEINSQEKFDQLVSKLLGNTYHAAGAVIFYTINKSAGREKLLEVMADPRRLLIEYNNAVQQASAENQSDFIFNSKLAKKIVSIGNE